MQPRVETLIGLTLLAAGCGSDASFRPGATDVPRPASSPQSEPQAARTVRWELFSQLASMQRLGPEFASRGHGTGDWNAQLRVNATASEGLTKLHLGTTMPRGSVLVQLHTDKRTGEPLQGFVMQKRESGYFPSGGDWDYGVIAVDGTIEQRGRLEFCARCHAEAPADFVFTRAGQER